MGKSSLAQMAAAADMLSSSLTGANSSSGGPENLRGPGSEGGPTVHRGRRKLVLPGEPFAELPFFTQMAVQEVGGMELPMNEA